MVDLADLVAQEKNEEAVVDTFKEEEEAEEAMTEIETIDRPCTIRTIAVEATMEEDTKEEVMIIEEEVVTDTKGETTETRTIPGEDEASANSSWYGQTLQNNMYLLNLFASLQRNCAFEFDSSSEG